jgi:hypothetical protein
MIAGYLADSLRVGQRNVVAVNLSGPASAARILVLLDELEGRELEFVLIDQTELSVTLITPADIQLIVDRWADAKKLRSAVIAVVAPNPVVYGLDRMFQLVSGADDRLSVFWNRSTAMAWLGEWDTRVERL